MGISGGVDRKPECLWIAQDGKAPHEMTKAEIAFELVSQFLIEVPGSISQTQVLIEQDGVEGQCARLARTCRLEIDNLRVHDKERYLILRPSQLAVRLSFPQPRPYANRRFSYGEAILRKRRQFTR